MSKQLLHFVAIGMIGTALITGATFTFGQQKTRDTNIKKDAEIRSSGDSNLRRYQQSISADRLAAQSYFSRVRLLRGTRNHNTWTKARRALSCFTVPATRLKTVWTKRRRRHQQHSMLLFQPFTVYRRVAQESQLELLNDGQVESPAHTRRQSRTTSLTFLLVTWPKLLKVM
jgi:hypothetical protein